MPVPAVRSGRARDRDAAGGGDAGPGLLWRRRDRAEPGDHRRVQRGAAGQLRPAAVRRAGRHDGRAGEVLLGPADRPVHAPHARPRALRGARLRRARSTAPARVPRLGRLEPPGRDRLPRGLQERGRVPREPAHQRARARPRAASCPGPIKPGEWAVELGVAAIVTQALGDADGKVGWRVEIQLSNDPAFADEPYQPAPYDSTPAPRGAWLVRRRLPRARRALGARRRDHDGDVRLRLQAALAGRRRPRLHHALGLRRAERVGRDRPLPARLPRQADRAQLGGDHLPRAHEQPHERAPTSTTAPGPSSSASTTARWCRSAGRGRRASCSTTCTRAGGFTQINHPTIFPSTDPFFQQFCRGCPWDYTDAETDYSKVDAIEVNDRAAAAHQPVHAERDRVLRAGAGRSGTRSRRSARATRTTPAARPGSCRRRPRSGRPPPWSTPTSCRRPASSAACKRRHTYVKLTGNKGPDVRLTAAVPGKKGDARHDRRRRARQRRRTSPRGC